MSADSLIVFPPFRLDLQNQQLWQETVLIPVRPKPFAVLAYLALHAGRLISREELVKAVWPDSYVSESVLRGYIREVRTALGDQAEAPRFIETVARRGYRFLPAVLTRVGSDQSSVISRGERSGGESPEADVTNGQSTLHTPHSAVPLVGRERELTRLHQWLSKAAHGTRQVVFVMGEPGIGKTTLVDAFLGSLGSRVPRQLDERPGAGSREQGTRSREQGAKLGAASLAPSSLLLAPGFARGQCIEHYGAGEAYLPVLDALGQLCRQPGGEQIVTFLSRYAPTWLMQMPAFVSDSELEALQRKVQGATRERMLREMAEALEALTAEQLLVLVLEDVHWSDPSTLDLLSLLAQRRGPARLFLLATYRPADVAVSGHPLRALKQELQARGHCEEVALGFLATAEVAQYLQQRFPRHEFPPELGRIIHQSTEGNPLFMVNVVDEWVRQGVLIETGGRWQLASTIEELAAGVPESLRQMIELQLERLTPEEQQVLETASVIGGEFTTATIAASTDEQMERVEAWCEGLAKRTQFLRARGTETQADGTITGRYGFLHALYPHVLYERLTLMQRIQLHRRVGEREEQTFGARVGEHAAELAMHFERGQDYPRAVQYLWQAAENAMQRNAYQEAIAFLNRALGTLPSLPDTPERTRQELALQIALGVPLLITKGYAAPEIERTYTRAREICQQLEAHPQHLPALAGLFRFHLVRAELSTARALGEQVLQMTRDSVDPLFRAAAHSMLGVALVWLGDFPQARDHLEQGQQLYDPQRDRYVALLYGDDTGVVCYAYGASTLWFLGYADHARKSIQAALALARDLAIPHILAFALDSAVWLNVHCREEDLAWQYLETLKEVASNQGFQHWLAATTIMQGRRLAQQHQEREGIALMRQGLAAYRATGAELGRAQFLLPLVEAYGRIGQAEEGLTLVNEALTAINKTGERNYEAELYRLRGELTLAEARGWRRGAGEEKSLASSVQGPKSHRGSNAHHDVNDAETRAVSDAHPTKFTSSSPQGSSLKPQVPSEVAQEAERCFLKAIAVARQQQAKALELRASMSLVRLRQQQATHHAARNTHRAIRGKLAEAHTMLSDVYNWFTEGFDAKDLQEAKALLENGA